MYTIPDPQTNEPETITVRHNPVQADRREFTVYAPPKRKYNNWSDYPHLNKLFKQWTMYRKQDILAVTISPPTLNYWRLRELAQSVEEIVNPYKCIWVVEEDKTGRGHFHGMIRCQRAQYGVVHQPDSLIAQLKTLCFVDAKYVHSVNSWINYITKDVTSQKYAPRINAHISCIQFLGLTAINQDAPCEEDNYRIINEDDFIHPSYQDWGYQPKSEPLYTVKTKEEWERTAEAEDNF